MLAFAMFLLMCIDFMVILSAYVVSFTGACGIGMPDKNKNIYLRFNIQGI